MRDLLWEAQFRKNLIQDVQRRSGQDATPLLILSERRFNDGAKVYGDSSFLTDGRDLIAELRDEISDGINYLEMEIQRMHSTNYDEPLRIANLYEAGVYLCLADNHVRAARRGED